MENIKTVFPPYITFIIGFGLIIFARYSGVINPISILSEAMQTTGFVVAIIGSGGLIRINRSATKTASEYRYIQIASYVFGALTPLLFLVALAKNNLFLILAWPIIISFILTLILSGSPKKKPIKKVGRFILQS